MQDVKTKYRHWANKNDKRSMKKPAKTWRGPFGFRRKKTPNSLADDDCLPSTPPNHATRPTVKHLPHRQKSALCYKYKDTSTPHFQQPNKQSKSTVFVADLIVTVQKLCPPATSLVLGRESYLYLCFGCKYEVSGIHLGKARMTKYPITKEWPSMKSEEIGCYPRQSSRGFDQ